MKRYAAMVRRPRAWATYDEDMGERPTITVYETDSEPEDTGLVTAEGVPIYRLSDKGPLGFCR